jgi:intergrase/recombinase
VNNGKKMVFARIVVERNIGSSPCRANKNMEKDIIRGAVANKLLNLGFPEDVVNKTVRHL